MINRYERPAEAQFMNTYVPIPFEQLYQLGTQAKADVEKATTELSAAMDKWSDFRSPSQTDTNTWYNETLGKIQPVVEELSSNLDALKTPEGRARLRGAINSVDRSKLAQLTQSRDSLLTRLKVIQELMIQGKYNPLWHDIDIAGYDTMKTGIFNDVSPLAYTSIKDLTNKYVDNLESSYLKTEGLYDYYGRTPDMIKGILDANRTGILSTPEAQKHVETIMRLAPGTTREQAEQELMDKAYTDNTEFLVTDRKANPFALQDRKNDAKRGSGAGQPGAQPLYLDKLNASLHGNRRMFKGEDGTEYVEPSDLERAVVTLNPNSQFMQNYVSTDAGNRRETAEKTIDELLRPQAQGVIPILASELGDLGEGVRTTAGVDVYPMQNKGGFQTIEGYMNQRAGISPSSGNLPWTEQRRSFEQDLLNGNIPSSAIEFKDAVLPENVTPGQESYAMKGYAYVPMTYLANKYPEEFGDYEKIVRDASGKNKIGDTLKKDKKATAFLKAIGGELAPNDGALSVVSGGTTLDRKTNKHGQTVGQGTFAGMINNPWDRTIDANQLYNDKYIRVPVMKRVLDTPLKRDIANQYEYLESNSGTKVNASLRDYNYQRTYRNGNIYSQPESDDDDE